MFFILVHMLCWTYRCVTKQCVGHVNMASLREDLSDVVKSLHQKLRTRLKEENGDFDKVWKIHCSDKESLQRYAAAMQSLATDQWTKNSPGGRADWCVKTCHEYFNGGGLVTALEKQKRRFEKEMATPCCCCLNISYDSNSIVDGKLSLLDVGSCYDPFSAYSEFSTVAIDLHPATKSVYKCDFLNLEVTSTHNKEHGFSLCSCKSNSSKSPSDMEKQQYNQGNNATDVETEKPVYPIKKLFPYSQSSSDFKRFFSGAEVSELPGAYFHVVIFSLLLSYFPMPAQRWTCCVKAHQLLAVNGILVIITPDSSHQNRNITMVKSWKAAIESIGFVRWRYLKDTHVHCMVFRKVSPCHHSCSRTCSCKINIKVTPSMLFMRQDFCDDKSSEFDGCDKYEDDNLTADSRNMDQGDNQEQRKKRKVGLSQ